MIRHDARKPVEFGIKRVAIRFAASSDHVERLDGTATDPFILKEGPMKKMSCSKIEAHEEDQEGTRKPTEEEATTTRTTTMMTTRKHKRKVHRVSVSTDVSFHAIPGCRDYLSVDIDSILRFGRLRQELLAGSPDLSTNQVDDSHFVLPPTIIRPIPHRPIHPKLRKVSTTAASFSSTTDPVNRRRRPTYPGLISPPSIQYSKSPTTSWLDLDY